MRIEKDTMGEMNLPDDSYYGAQTQRAFQNFQISSLKMPRPMIAAMALIKRSAAVVNYKLGSLDSNIKDAIVKSSDEVIQGKFDNQFIVDIYQTGSGTSSNMNTNEVIANRACEILKGKKGDKSLVHPNDHVNFGQSSNDVIPTAIHISTTIELLKRLIPELKLLKKSLSKKSKEFNKIIKIGRTHTQDATPITLGQEFSGYCEQIRKNKERIINAKKELAYVPQGGTAVGTGMNAPKNFDKIFCKILSKIAKKNYFPAKNKFESIAAHDSLVNLSGTLNTLSVSLLKITNDIRFLASGPRSGLGELQLPENEPGSSIMPGKINPTQIEAINMVCLKVMGNHSSTSLAGSQGHFELNALKPLIIYNIVQSMNLLSDAINSFNKNCLKKIKAKQYILFSKTFCVFQDNWMQKQVWENQSLMRTIFHHSLPLP